MERFIVAEVLDNSILDKLQISKDEYIKILTKSQLIKLCYKKLALGSIWKELYTRINACTDNKYFIYLSPFNYEPIYEVQKALSFAGAYGGINNAYTLPVINFISAMTSEKALEHIDTWINYVNNMDSTGTIKILADTINTDSE